MEANAKSMYFLGEYKELAVPFFQRNYVWKEENWEELLKNFEDDAVVPFLGSIILKEESGKKSTIIDGQQRLTTVTILAKAIYDSLSAQSKHPSSGIRTGIESYLFYRNNAADDFEDSSIRISHSRNDRGEYERIITAEMLSETPIDLDTINDQSSRIAQCYKYYREKLYGRSDRDLKRLFNLMFDKDRKVFVLIELKQGDVNEQTIFDTINRAGIRLSTADIIKNNFYKHLLNAAGADETRKEKVYNTYKTCWEDIFYQEQGLVNVWEEERIFGNVKHNNLEFLLYCIACIKWGEDGDLFAKLETVFERETSTMGFAELLDLAKEIKEYALIFKKYILDFKASLQSEDSSEYFKYKENVRRLLLILQKFGVQMFYPYVIMRLKDVNQDENDAQLAKDFLILESFVMRRKVSARGTHDYTKKCYEIIKNGIHCLTASDLAVPDAGISDLDMQVRLGETTDETAKMILFWIELYRRAHGNIDVDALEYKFTLEHIMPKKWEAHWSDVPIKDKGEVLSSDSEEGRRCRNIAIQSIGNKTLLLCNLNSSLKHEAFLKKVNGDGAKRPGYRHHTLLQITKEVVEMAEHDPVWDEQRIENRKTNLYRQFLTLWPSFADELPAAREEELDEDADPVLDQYTNEELDDAAKLLEAVPLASGTALEEDRRSADYVTQEELTTRVSVQSETVDRYIKEGKLIPDYVERISEQRSINYFLTARLPQYAEEFGWTMIDDANRKEFFMDMIREMRLNYSYKPIFWKGLLEHADAEGVVNIWHLVAYFRNFFDARRAANLIVEKADSAYQDPQITDEAILHHILTYPFKRFKDIGAVAYNKETGEIKVDAVIWNTLSAEDKAEIIDVCNDKIEKYFSTLSPF